MLARYRYRIYPDGGQRRMLARTFGCARVVFNDAISLRDQAYAAGRKITDTQVQNAVITRAKQTTERGWLREVASVALVQACQDARRAYRNWFDSMSGKRMGRKVGRPRFRKRHGRQSIRLTRNGFSVRPHQAGDRLYVAKVGELKVEWSRALPSTPSSVTIIQEPDGRYYASFVVERDAQPLPMIETEVGVDVGLRHLAVLSTGEKIDNPRLLRGAERRLAAAQQSLSRKQKGSKNRDKARHRVAVLHRKVRETRLDHAHKTALKLIRENQAIYVEDIAVVGLARTRLAKSVHDAGWSQLLRLIEEKAEFYGRNFRRINRFAPSTQVCSQCQQQTGPKGAANLGVTAWSCGKCNRSHDRDTNAATNILAWGHQERLNALWRQEKTSTSVLAPAGEAGTHRSTQALAA